MDATGHDVCPRQFLINNLLVRIHFSIEMIRWTGLAPREFDFPFPGSLTSSFLECVPPNVLHPLSPVPLSAANMARTRHLTPDYGLDFQVEDLDIKAMIWP